ncbi:MAG: hypothetical protein MUO72_00010 [Bacteroidales bacterium]|nr:hypothetical protein [Bacteroidales bacterium]
MPLKNLIALAFKDVFSEKEQQPIETLISDISTVNSLEILGYFNAQLHTIEQDTSKQIEFLKIWMNRFPKEVIGKVIGFIKKFEGKQNANFVFINNVSSLMLIEQILKYHNNTKPLVNISPEQELNLFKAYLICSQQWTDEQMKAYNGEEITNPESFVNLLLPIHLPFQEILEFKDFRLQFIKAVYFFKFCESNIFFTKYLEKFLKVYSLESWKIYLLNIISIYVRKFEPLKTPSVLKIGSEFPQIRNFLDNLSIDPKSFIIKSDFLSLREKPVYKIDDETYIFLNLNFLVDKIFQGIQFDFAGILTKSGTLYKGKLIKTFADFKNAYAEQFSENGLFFRVMNYAFENSKYIKYDGNQLKKSLGDGFPDYYIRDKSKVYLFEYKDILLNSDIKHSYSISDIKSEISKKLIANEKGAPKGITQLVNYIEKLRNNAFQKLDNYDFTRVSIYPIIIYTDFSFNLSGINHFLKTEFSKILDNKKLNNRHLIKDLILIDLDTFIKFQDLFRDKRLRLNDSLNDFYNLTNNKNKPYDTVIPFNMFIHNKTLKIDYDSPKMLKDELGEIMPKN